MPTIILLIHVSVECSYLYEILIIMGKALAENTSVPVNTNLISVSRPYDDYSIKNNEAICFSH